MTGPKPTEPVGGRIESVDAVKGALVVGVVVIHLFAGPLRDPDELGSPALFALVLGDTAARACVPGFLLISAALLGRSALRRPVTYRDFLRRRAARLLPAYLLWSAVLTLLGPKPSIGRVATDWLAGSASYHTYFVPLVIHLYLLFPLLQRGLRGAVANRRGALALAAVAFAAAVARPLWTPPLWALADGPGLAAAYFRAGPLAALSWLPWFVLGLAAAPHLETLLPRLWQPASRRLAWLVAVTCLVGVAVRRFSLLDWQPGGGAAAQQAILGFGTWDTPIAALPVLLVLFACRWRDGLAVRLGRASYGLYLSHVVVLELLRRSAFGSALAQPLGAMVGVVAVLALSLALVSILAAVPLLRPISGVEPARSG